MNCVRMTRTLATIFMGVAVIAAAGCDDDDEEVTGPDEMSDANVVAVAMAANTGEVVTSEPVAGRAVDADVRAYAQMMVTDHTSANQQLQALGIAPEQNALSQQLTQLAVQATALLGQLPAEALDTTYMNIQVTLHQSALGALDEQLIPEAESTTLRNLLGQMRATVATHLALALQIRTELRASLR